MKVITTLLFALCLMSCEQDSRYVQAKIDQNGYGIVNYDHCSVVLTPNAIIVKKDSLVYNPHTGSSTWMPTVRVTPLNEKNRDSLITAINVAIADTTR